MGSDIVSGWQAVRGRREKRQRIVNAGCEVLTVGLMNLMGLFGPVGRIGLFVELPDARGGYLLENFQ